MTEQEVQGDVAFQNIGLTYQREIDKLNKDLNNQKFTGFSLQKFKHSEVGLIYFLLKTTFLEDILCKFTKEISHEDENIKINLLIISERLCCEHCSILLKSLESLLPFKLNAALHVLGNLNKAKLAYTWKTSFFYGQVSFKTEHLNDMNKTENKKKRILR